MGYCHFLCMFFNVHQSSVLTVLFGCYVAGATWNCCHLGTFFVHHTTMHHVASLHAKPHTHSACIVFNCNLPPALLAEWPGSFMCYCSNVGGTDTEIRTSTENLPWTRKFSHCSSQNLNQRPFDHKCSALTTELYLLHVAACTAWLHSVESIINTFPCPQLVGFVCIWKCEGKTFRKKWS